MFAVELKTDPIIVGAGVECLPKLLDGRTLSIRGQSRRLFETAAHFPGFPEVLLFCVVLGQSAPGKCHPLGMHFDFADQLRSIAALRPVLKELHFLLGGKSLKRWIMFEKAMRRGHEGGAAGMLEKDECQVMMNRAEFSEILVHSRIVLGGERQHSTINFTALRTGAAQRFPPRRDREIRVGAKPDDSFFVGDFVGVGLEEPRPPEIRQRVTRRMFRADFPDRAQEIRLPFDWCPFDRSGVVFDRLDVGVEALVRIAG